MSNSLVMTFIGPDRPGLVRALAAIVADHGASWAESRLVCLAERFAGVVHITAPAAKTDALRAALQAEAARLGLQVFVEAGTDAADVETVSFGLELTGADHEGIVRDVTTVLANHGINVEEAATEVDSAPMSGELIFQCVMALSGPATVDFDALEAELEALADDLQVELSLDR